ncbi:PAS domain-containing sensor histidine kinase [Flavobacterium album]|uniref:histidine kinase n=1 Tax=Flavobacterium album TaxID=2175091 RepID=A0A2S1R1N9_9FLAO|nr:PAS domain-containing sensor histidine kinase [Flavobacterium album]AWH86555.1 PAS domain-containing sensor histidine kinase [Flavobacterium album]
MEIEQIYLLRSVIDNAPYPMGVYVGDDFTIELANKSMIATYGKGNDVIGKSYRKLLPELNDQQIFDQIERVRSTGIPFHAKDQRVDLVIDGVRKVHYFNYSFTPIYTPEGAIYGVMNTGMDVTDLNNARQKVIEGEDKLKMAIDNANLGTYEINFSDNFIRTSGKFNEIWKVSPPITNDHLISKIHPDDLIVRQKALEAGEIVGKMDYEVRIIHDDGSIRWLRINAIYLTDDYDNRVGLYGTVQDITEERDFSRQLLQQVKERTEDLHRSNDNLRQFAHVISHDMKEPLRKIEFFNSRMRDEVLSGSTEGLRYSEKIAKSATRMNMLIDGVLTYSKHNKAFYKIETVDLNDVLNSVTSDLELTILEKNANITSDELPAVQGALILLNQLFYNLIANSLKFSRPGIPPDICITHKFQYLEDENKVVLSFRDNGVGFDQKHAARIFEPFTRLHSQDEYDGTGLGLSLCQKIATRHHGNIRAHGIPGEGSLIEVSLPLNQSVIEV